MCALDLACIKGRHCMTEEGGEHGETQCSPCWMQYMVASCLLAKHSWEELLPAPMAPYAVGMALPAAAALK